jgi:integrase/recombinase XerD
MTPLRAKMIMDMQLHRLAPGTQALYLREVASLATYYGRSPDQLTSDEIRAYLHHLLVERQLAWSTCNVTAAAIRFFYVETLGWPMAQLHLPPRTDRQRLPRVLSAEELHHLFRAARHPKHRALLMTTYAAGLRVSEVVRLQVTDIESERMCIRVNQGKGNKDRDTLLSTRWLTELRAYWKLFRPPRWLFPGRLLTEPMPSGTARTIYERARQRAQLPRGASMHALRNAST